MRFPDGTLRTVQADGSERTEFPDGTLQIVTPGGERTIDYGNGQRELHTAAFKRRTYADGTVSFRLQGVTGSYDPCIRDGKYLNLFCKVLWKRRSELTWWISLQ